MKSHDSRTIRGFTLVELLVVIAILVVLAALSFLGLTKMRAAGDRAATVSIMRQLQVANAGYAVDHNGRYVPIVTKDANKAIGMEWYRDPEFLAYLTGDQSQVENPGQEVIVPQGILDPVVVRARKRYWDKLSASYGFNSTGLTYPQDDKSAPYSYKVVDVANPARTAFIATATDYTVTYAGRFLWKDTPVEGKTTNSKMAYRHGGKAVIVHYDGSVGMVGMEDLKRIDSQGGKENPFWKAKE